MAGLGLRRAELHSPGVFICSANASESLKDGLLPHSSVSTDLSSALGLLSNTLQEELTTEELYCMSQKVVSLKIDLKIHLNLVNSLTDVRDKARKASLGLAHAGDWINVIPSPILGLHIRSSD